MLGDLHPKKGEKEWIIDEFYRKFFMEQKIQSEDLGEVCLKFSHTECGDGKDILINYSFCLGKPGFPNEQLGRAGSYSLFQQLTVVEGLVEPTLRLRRHSTQSIRHFMREISMKVRQTKTNGHNRS